MLTGQPPFTGATPTAVLMKRLSSPPPPLAKMRPDAPGVLRDAIEGMLAQNPDERFQSCADVVRMLSGATPVSGGHKTAEILSLRGRQRSRRNWYVAVGLAMVIALGALGIALRPHAAPPAAVKPPVDDDMARIAAGTYAIGSDQGPATSRPTHPVALDAFGLDKSEVTIGEYGRYVATGKAMAPWSGQPDTALPVTGVLWAEATNYCAWRHPDGGRLPTEAEWEAAARGTAARTYPWGSAWDPASSNTASARRNGTAPPGSYPHGDTPEGIHDLIGNVWEWTSTVFAPYPGGAPISGTSVQSYVIRGGAFNSPDAVATTTQRGYLPSAADRGSLAWTGFRCAMPERQTAAKR
jgi:iron(II)-dependent oxidoreductase